MGAIEQDRPWNLCLAEGLMRHFTVRRPHAGRDQQYKSLIKRKHHRNAISRGELAWDLLGQGRNSIRSPIFRVNIGNAEGGWRLRPLPGSCGMES